MRTSHHTTRARYALAGAALAIVASASPTTGMAQSSSTGATTVPNAGMRWQALVGCWAPDGVVADGARAPQAVCVLPAGDAAAEIVTVAEGKVASRETIDASGVAVPSTRDKCTGADRATWSADGRRVYLTAKHECDGTRIDESGIMAMPSASEWVDVRGVSVAGGPADVRVRRWHAVPVEMVALPTDVARDVSAALAERPMVRTASRANAAAGPGVAEVIEASKTVDAAVVEAWLVENGDGFGMDARKLKQVADAGVPTRVIDVMVALSYPGRFAVGRRASDVAIRPQVDTTVRRPSDVSTSIYDGGIASYGSRGRYCDDALLYSTRQRCWTESPYGYGPYGYAPYGWGGTSYGYGYDPRSGPVVIVDGGNGNRGGKVVKGTGYTRGEGASNDGSERSAQPRTRDDGSSSGSSSRGDRSTRSQGGSSGSSDRSSGTKGSEGSRSSGNSGSSNSGRTAKPKNP